MSELNIEIIEKPGSISVVRLKGVLDAYTIGQLNQSFDGLNLAARDRIVVNLGGVSYINSICMGVFISQKTAVVKKGGRIVLSNIPSNILKVFSLIGFHKIFEIYEEENSGVESFSK